ncbi:hypothetical protein HYPSUDRAFT_70652 [Hypholoma sublateritium FD-334 SS-4]|uniref:Ferritin-like domain-containing protein n=1 Tax=Hypholoma sublateritium (strain FD-334 SS-4) TaxID=945553 RepID=A0A0D2M2Z3_HYPSF|nr:hypothetical protein HYPSUDRAFT_70652 [Hypholoma sublateritium FD-334 SS-4]
MAAYYKYPDFTVLNYALTLEHLENAFYHQALDRFDEQAFLDAGLPSWVRGRFEQIAEHEATHVQLLSAALGDRATQPCAYDFPYNDPRSFAALSQVLEGVGVTAYTGAAQYISNKAYLTAAASILSTEARHASWIASAVNKFAGWSGAFDVPLDFNEVYSLASPFIVSCPATNPSLPVKAYPALRFSDPAPGKNSYIEIAQSGVEATFIAFLTGLDTIFVRVENGAVKIPEYISGEIYAVATTSGTEASPSTIVAGPAILSFELNSRYQLISAHQAN